MNSDITTFGRSGPKKWIVERETSFEEIENSYLDVTTSGAAVFSDDNGPHTVFASGVWSVISDGEHRDE